jgi:hypothetical protein
MKRTAYVALITTVFVAAVSPAQVFGSNVLLFRRAVSSLPTIREVSSTSLSTTC